MPTSSGDAIFAFKGIVHPKRKKERKKIQTLSTHPHANERTGEVLSPQNTAEVSQEKGKYLHM